MTLLTKLIPGTQESLPVIGLGSYQTFERTLEEWRTVGKIRYRGVTHYTAGAHAAVAKVMRQHALDFLQINYSLAEREAENLRLPLAAERGIAVIVNRPFAGG